MAIPKSQLFSRTYEQRNSMNIQRKERERQDAETNRRMEELRQENESQREVIDNLQNPPPPPPIEEPPIEGQSFSTQSISSTSEISPSVSILSSGAREVNKPESDQGDYIVTRRSTADKRGVVQSEYARFGTYEEAKAEIDKINAQPFRYRDSFGGTGLYVVPEGEAFNDLITKSPAQRKLEGDNKRIAEQNRLSRQAAEKATTGSPISSVEKEAFRKTQGKSIEQAIKEVDASALVGNYGNE